MPIVWQLSAVHFTSSTILYGVVIQNRPYRYSNKSGKFKNIVNVLGSYFVRPISNEEIHMLLNGNRISTKTDLQGGFSIKCSSSIIDEIKIYCAVLKSCSITRVEGTPRYESIQ